MKKFTINCDFEGQIAPFTIFIGTPKGGNHPLTHQAKWLSDNRGGTIPTEVMDALSRLQELSAQNGVSLEELCVYALGSQEDESTSRSSEPYTTVSIDEQQNDIQNDPYEDSDPKSNDTYAEDIISQDDDGANNTPENTDNNTHNNK